MQDLEGGARDVVRGVPGKRNDMGEDAAGEQAQWCLGGSEWQMWGGGESSSGAGEGFGAGTLHDLLIP